MVMEIIKVFIGMTTGAIVLIGGYMTIQYFRLYRPLVRAIKNIDCATKEEEA